MVSARDVAILDHIGRYRLTLRDVLVEAFALENPGNVLQRLRDAGLIVERRGLPGRVSYYQLTAAGACDRVSPERARPMKPDALRTHLAVLWHCHFGQHPAVRLEEPQLRDLFGPQAPPGKQVAYCLADYGDRKRVLRVLVPGDAVPAARVAKTVAAVRLDLARAGGDVAAWTLAGALGILVLADSPERAARLERAVAETDVSYNTFVAVEPAATPGTLLRFLTDRRRDYRGDPHSGPSRS